MSVTIPPPPIPSWHMQGTTLPLIFTQTKNWFTVPDLKPTQSLTQY